MSPIVWDIVQKTNAQAVKQNNLVLAAKLVTLGVDIGLVTRVIGLSEEEIQDHLARSKT